jgi:hypothetical protein
MGEELMTLQSTWEPEVEQGFLDYEERRELPATAFAFPAQRKEPLLNASHVLRALARIQRVRDVSDEDRDLAFVNIKKAAEFYGIRVVETDWRQVGRKPETVGSQAVGKSEVK